MTVLVLATARAGAALGSLRDAWSGEGRTVRLELSANRPETGRPLVDLVTDAGADAVLVVGPRQYSPRTAATGPVLTTDDGRVVPVGWLPDAGVDHVRVFAAAAAAVHARASVASGAGTVGDHAEITGRTIAVLGQRHRRFDDLAIRILRLVDEARAAADRPEVGLTSVRWTAYDLHRDDLVAALALGPALAVYVGHGRPSGWAGYAGTRAHHLGAEVAPGWQPSAVILSLSCSTSSRYRTGLSFAEAIVLRGATAAAVGAVRTTSHLANARWALRLTRAAAGARSVGDLVAAVAPHDPAAGVYRLIGDPTAPLIDAITMDRHHDLTEVA